jgi:hypothetical protein
MKQMDQVFTYKAPLTEKAMLVLHIKGERIWHHNFAVHDRFGIDVHVEIVIDGHCATVERLTTYRDGRWEEGLAYQVADEYIQRMKSRATMIG